VGEGWGEGILQITAIFPNTLTAEIQALWLVALSLALSHGREDGAAVGVKGSARKMGCAGCFLPATDWTASVITGKPQPLETTMHPEDDDYDDENFDREAELEREWQEMEDEENAEDYEEDWDNLERSGEDGWYYDDEGDERDNLDDYGYDDEYRDDD